MFEKLLPFFKRMHLAAQEAGLQVAPSWIVSDLLSIVNALPSAPRGEDIVAKIKL